MTLREARSRASVSRARGLALEVFLVRRRAAQKFVLVFPVPEARWRRRSFPRLEFSRGASAFWR